MATELTVPGDLVGLRLVQDLIEDALGSSGYPEHDIFALKLEIEEVLIDAIKHGTRLDPDKQLHIAYTITADQLDIRITAEGSGQTRTVRRPPGA